MTDRVQAAFLARDDRLVLTSEESLAVLSQVLKELQKLTFMVAQMSDIEITDEDVE